MPLKERTCRTLPNHYCPLSAWATAGSHSIITSRVMSDLSIVEPRGDRLDLISLQMSSPRCENVPTVYFGSECPGDGHLSTSNPATTRCHQLLTGTQKNETFKWFLFTWRTLSNLVPSQQLPCGRPINKPGSQPTCLALRWQTPTVWFNRTTHISQLLQICLNNNRIVWFGGKSSVLAAHYILHRQLTIKMTSQKRVCECFWG